MSSTVGTEPKALPSSTTLANRFEVQPEAAGLRLMRKTGVALVELLDHIGASSRSIDGYIRECMAAPYRLGLTAIRSHTATARDDQSTTNRRLTQVFGLQYQVGHQGLVFEVRLVLNGVP